MLFHSGMGESGLRCTFRNFQQLEDKTRAREIAMAWNYGPKGIVFYGPTGSGKTHLGCAIANKMIRKGIYTRFLRSVEIPRADQDRLAELVTDNIPLLVLDDIGAEKGTDRSLECLYFIVDGRAWNGLPTIYTTNYRQSDLQARLPGGYGERVVSRLIGHCAWVPVGGEDMRLCRSTLSQNVASSSECCDRKDSEEQHS